MAHNLILIDKKHTNHYNMRRIIFAMAAVLFCTLTVNAQEITSQNTQDYVEVSVRVSKDVLPDEIFLNITINEKDNKGKISVQQQENQMIKALDGLGIDVKEALTINDMGSQLKSYALKKDNIFVSRNYTLKVTTATMAAEAIEALNKLDIASVSVGKVSISDTLEREVKNQLLTEAAQKARENAKILSEAVGSTIGKAIYIQNYYSFDSAANGRIMMKSYAAMDSSTSVQEEETVELQVSKQSLSINVSCKFKLL